MTERLSKLQKWILIKALEVVPYDRNTTRKFFGKKYSPSKSNKEIGWWLKDQMSKEAQAEQLEERQREHRIFDYDLMKWTDKTEIIKYLVPKDKYVATRAEEATISRTLKNLINKGLLKQPRKWSTYSLTEEGFAIANKCSCAQKTVNNSYAGTQTVNNSAKPFTILSFSEYQTKIDEYEAKRAAYFKPRVQPSPEKEQKMFELKQYLNQFTLKFNVDAIRKTCCQDCQKKIDQFAIECGLEKLQKLKKEIEEMS